MQIDTKLHRIRVNFIVTQEIERFVYLYLIVSNDIHVIDTGVAGAEKIIQEYLKSIGRNIDEVKSVLLTHSHPDHIGSAYAIKELSNCDVYACEAEKDWIENIDKQFAERPIPNFYTLLNKSVVVDKVVKDNDVLMLENGITIKIIDTKGHSSGSLSFLWIEQGELFTGDAIPVIGDIPIYVSAYDSIDTLKRLLFVDGVKRYLSSWDDIYNEEIGIEAIKKSLDYLSQINDTVKNIVANSEKNMDEIYIRVCHALSLNHLIQNPLFRKSIYANINEMGK